MGALWEARAGRLSIQVLHEFYVTVTQKLSPGLAAEDARLDVRDLAAWHPVALDVSLIEGAWSLQDRHSISFWDALIVSAAARAECETLLSEDLQEGHGFAITTVVNPFLHRPGDVVL